MVFYLKYRPQKISELDSQQVRERLTSIISSGQIPHALLLAGPKGTGKTSVARIIAKIINCLQHPTSHLSLPTSNVEPCNNCPSCISITSGSNLDVLEIDAASNRGIEEIRDLREKIHLSPSSSRYKVYIIDEVHMLTTEAFNALLKTLEEPPAHAIFILATTDPHKVPATVSSRCVEIYFQKATTDELGRALRRVAECEKIAASEEVLAAIADLGDGAFRDAVKNLEELSRSGKTIELDEVYALRGYNPAEAENFLKLLSQRDNKGLLEFIAQMSVRGMAAPVFLNAILGRLHGLFLSSYGIGDKSEPEKVKFTREEIKTLMTIFSAALKESKYSSIAQLPLELAVIEWCENKIQSKKPTSQSNATNIIKLQDLIAAVKPRNHSIAAILRSCQPLTWAGNIAMIETPYKFHYQRLSEPETISLLSEVVSKLLDRKVQVKPMIKT